MFDISLDVKRHASFIPVCMVLWLGFFWSNRMIWWFKPSIVAPGNFNPKHCNLLRIISFLKHHWWWIHQLLMLCFLAIVIFLLLYFPWQYYFENCFWSGNILLFFIFTPFSCFYIESVSNLLAFLLLIGLCLLEVFNKVNSIEGAF